MLVTTVYLAAYSGSELVAFDVARYFASLGAQVTIATNYIDPVVQSAVPPNIDVTDQVEACELGSFDLVWCQHSLIALFDAKALAAVAESGRLPSIVLVSLSRSTALEAIDLHLAEVLEAPVLCNSTITQRHWSELAADYQCEAVRSFDNAPLAEFWEVAARRRGPSHSRARWSRRFRRWALLERDDAQLRHVTAISNHRPEELTAALDELERRGIMVRRIGRFDESTLVTPSMFEATDAVITIGRSAHFSLAAGVPVFTYDHFGGDGWLRNESFEEAFDYNFTGRPRERMATSPELVAELIDGYPRALKEMSRIRKRREVAGLHLETHLDELLSRAMDSDRVRLVSYRVAERLQVRSTREHFAMAHSTQQAIRDQLRNQYLQQQP
ncbi:MAG TPA: hypothetical protein DCQ04_05755 [Actinobacteria bacterium]|nr:hypothetical protein [Actinomycetota bacterium]